MKRNTTIAVLAFAIAVFFFFGGLTTAQFLTAGGVMPGLAQIVPGTYQETQDYDIPTATDLSPISTFWEVREKIKNKFVYPVEDDSELTYGAIRGMLASLGDPYTRFLDPKQYKDFRTENTGHFDGIGAVLQWQSDEATGQGYVVISSVIKGGPASLTQLRSKDIVVKVDDDSVKGLTLDQVVNKIRGKRGTVVTLTVIRQGVNEPLDIAITRDKVDFPTVEYNMIDGTKIGYVWLRSFNEIAERRTREAIVDLKSQGMEGLVFDMSMDPGGILDAAVAVGGFFLNGGPVVYIKGRDAEAQPLNAPNGTLVPDDMPIVVLVDGGSASASEIVAGALKERHRAEVVGHYTFGKSKVQTIIEMRDGSALFLSTAVYLTPDMTDISIEDEKGNRGVKPDIIFPDPDPKGQYTVESWHQEQIDKAVDVLKKKMQ